MCGCFAYMHVCVPRACLELEEARECAGSPGTGAIEGCELLCQCCESNMEVKAELLSMDPSLQPHCGCHRVIIVTVVVITITAIITILCYLYECFTSQISYLKAVSLFFILSMSFNFSIF